MAEVVMDDMAIGDPASLLAQFWRFWASFPGIHIAQFPFQVIVNCGVISLMQCSNRQAEARMTCGIGIKFFLRGNCPRNCPLASRTI
jgi:hypothetical protein